MAGEDAHHRARGLSAGHPAVLNLNNAPNGLESFSDDGHLAFVNMPSAQQWREEIVSPMSPPPTYDLLLRSPTLQRQWNIQPREDEGREELPGYSTAINLEGVFSKKMELEGAINRASDRSWNKVIVKLQGTALTFYKCRSRGLFGIFDGHSSSASSVDGMKKGEFLRSYNLQHADVGIASDYNKKQYVLRLRAEADQFLLSCHNIETFVLWLQSLFAAIDLAPPLDERSIPRDLSIPRRSRPSGLTGYYQSTAQSQLVAAQHQILISQYPNLGSAVNTGPTSPRSLSNNPSSLLPTSILLRARQSFLYAPGNPPNPSLTSEGKWRPQHQWTHFYDMLYAKRCMAVLTHRSPRKSDLMVWRGKQWRVDWKTGRLEMCQDFNNRSPAAIEARPPSYAEVYSPSGGIWEGSSIRMVEAVPRESVHMGDEFLRRASGVAI